ncbi:hypothetical protein [Aliarcobacter cibarius]|uniref:Uncharacterized protein n=1 Tax=Aliarcobacter cibarius TaxID=255507 RepID=A0A7L5JSL3_9BACT|nr:hypothetical protein [Aliarcobacter cibarius]QKJ28129.1 hypothetical protein ACBT_2249 [Aliarcobacter cibarius]TLT05231.1 hypothetical protein FE248_00640 [Aliarcobacter cibarius]
MKIFLMIFIIFSPIFAKDIKLENQEKIKSPKETKKNLVNSKQKIDEPKSMVFKDTPILNILEIKPSYTEEKYNLSNKYAPILKYNNGNEDYDLDYKLGLEYELNEETGKLEKVKFDVETKFKGIN